MSHTDQKFGTAINCMDGRAIEATIAWMKNEYHLDFVDNITEPGMDALIGKMSEMERAYLKKKLAISINNHGSRVVAVVGHEDCAGNPVDSAAHHVCITADIESIKEVVAEINPEGAVTIIGLWAHEAENHKDWVAEKV